MFKDLKLNYKRKRLRYWEDRVSDLTDEIGTWGFAMSPSQRRRGGDLIAEARMNISVLTEQIENAERRG